MNIDSTIIFDLVFTIFTLGLALIVIVIFFSRLLKRSNRYQKELESLKADIARKNSLLLDEARGKAVRMIDDANNKALDIIQKSNLFIGISNENFNNQLRTVTQTQLKSFEKSTSDFIKLYERVLNDLKTKNIEIFQNISKNIEVNTLDEIKKFKETIEKETISSEKMLKKKVSHEYMLAKKDIEAYREEKINSINNNIYEILERVSKIVIGKAIDLSSQEQLIIDSLEKAKKEGVFRDEE